MGSVGEVLLAPAQELQRQRLLDDAVAVYAGTDRPAEDVEYVRPLRKVADRADVVGGEDEPVRVPSEDADVVREDDRGEQAGRRALPLAGRGQRAVDAHDLHAVAGLDPVDQVVVEDQLDRPGELSHWRPLRHLLQRHGLVVLVHAQPELGLEDVPVLVLRGVARAG